MLHGVKLLCSVIAALARLVAKVLVGKALLALMPLCSPRPAVQVVVAPSPPARAAVKKPPPQPVLLLHHGAVAVAEAGDRQQSAGSFRDHHQLLSPAPPPPMAAGAEERKATAAGSRPVRGRPSRLIIPPAAAARGGGDPFGEAEGRETDDAATEVEARGEGFCLASRRGVRHAMEDGYGVITDTAAGGSRLAFYGVYDGHGGRAAVDLVADRLGKNVIAALLAAATPTTAAAECRHQPGSPASSSSPLSSSLSQQRKDDQLDVMAAIRAGYLATDSDFLSQGARGGACAATALVRNGDLYVANVGDCRAVLGSRGGAATALTSDHTPASHDERRRIETSGGYVSCGGGGVWRVQDCLAVSRAFGDADVKPWGVTCEPEIRRLPLTADCRFLLLASDGLWNKVSNQEAVDAVAALSGAGAGVSVESCKELVAMARSRGSRDDITVMAVDLRPFVPAAVDGSNSMHAC